MLGFLFRHFRPPQAVDPFFGSLRFMKAARGHQSYWEAARWFEPLGRTIEVSIDAAVHDAAPSQEQRSFFEWVENEYSTILKAAAEALRNDEWSKIVGESLESDFELGGFSIPLQDQDKKEWDISFERTDGRFLLTFYFDGLSVRMISVDS